jgi:hypothetical protein
VGQKFSDAFKPEHGDTLANNHTQHNLALMVIQGIQGALSNQPTLPTNEPQQPQKGVRHARQLTENIGWQHLLKGRFSKRWTKIQGRHILEDPDLDQQKQSGGRWLKLVHHHLWTLVWQVWLARNEDLHSRNGDEKERKRLEKPHPRITVHAKQDLLLASDKQIFELPIHDHMLLHGRELETWARLVMPTVKRALSDAEQHLPDTNHTMLDFIAPARPTL